jgi:hypothetical protein
MEIINKSQFVFLCSDKVSDGPGLRLRESMGTTECFSFTFFVIGCVADAPVEIVVTVEVDACLCSGALIRLYMHILSLLRQRASLKKLIFYEGDAIDVHRRNYIIFILNE